MMDAASAAVSRRGRGWSVRLWPKGPAAGLAERFRQEHKNQLARWELARRAQPLRAATLRRALALAERVEARLKAPPASLSAAQRAEIDALVKEAEAAPRDPLGIATPWDRRGKP